MRTCTCGKPGRYKDGSCTGCYQRFRYQNDSAYRARVVERERARRECSRGTINQQQRKRYADDPRLRANNAVCNMRRKGFTPELLAALRELQQGRCAIDGVLLNNERRSLHEEHKDHTGARTPRGLLCMACNLALGFYEKSQRAAGLHIPEYEAYLLAPPTQRLSGSGLA